MIRIDIFGFPDCPNLEPTVRRVHQVISAVGRPAEVTVHMVSEAEDPTQLRFLGSPTVHVNGIDIEPAARARGDFAFGCRMYGTAAAPPASMIEAAIREAGPAS